MISAAPDGALSAGRSYWKPALPAALWAILDKIVDDYAPVIAGLENDIEQVEATVFRGRRPPPSGSTNCAGRRPISTGRCTPCSGPSTPWSEPPTRRSGEHLIPFFRDVNDHLKLVNEEVVGQRDLLATVLQANIAVISVEQNDISVRQNETTKQLTIIATIFLPLSFLTGFFGMNFGWLVGHVTSLWAFLVFGVGSLVVSCVVLFAWFRRGGLLRSDQQNGHK